MNKKSLIVVLPMMLALALTGCNASDIGTKELPNVAVSETTSPSASASPSAAPETPAAVETPKETTAPAAPVSGTAMEALNKLVVADEADSDAYDRDLFNHWTSNNKTGCDTRYAVLVEESVTKAVTSGCKVISGEWNSVYDGKKVTDPKTIDIDHMIPLKEAWESGASKWDSQARESYANDLSSPESLVAVTAASNRSKSDRDPAGYLPTDANNLCSYVTNWISVKARWNFTIDTQEKSAMKTVLDKCGDSSISNVAPAPAAEAPANVPAPVEAAPVAGTDGNDPKYTSCKAAIAGGFGPYTKGEPEYDWYRDGDGDGKVCEK